MLLGSVFLLLLHAAHSHKASQDPQGLSCVNDFVNNVSCSWHRTPQLLAPGVDCWLVGVKTTWLLRNRERLETPMARRCKLRHHRGSVPGCSLVFENKIFNKVEVMPNISVECNGTTVDAINKYKPVDHIKVNPPGLPSVNRTDNHTWISWSPGFPQSRYIKLLEFEVEVAQDSQTWKKARTFQTHEHAIRLPSAQLTGSCQVRVRARYPDQGRSRWSSWSPTASWMGATEQDQDRFWVKRGLLLSVGLALLMLLVYGSYVISGRLRGNPVPSPSKYFHSLHSVHKGNLKKWLNPLSASDSFFTAEASDQISPVVVCQGWDVSPSTSPSSSSTSALLHFQTCPSADSDTSGVVDNLSSSSSSCFYNMGYFASASSSSSACTDPSAAYFAYQDVFHSHHLHVALCPAFTAPPAYELLKREPQSPDSGFGLEQEDDEDKDARRLNVSDDPFQLCPPSSSPPVLTQRSSDSRQVEAPPPAGGGSTSWPVAGMCRSSSMPVEPCKTGYLTLKELQTTFSNKSI